MKARGSAAPAAVQAGPLVVAAPSVRAPAKTQRRPQTKGAVVILDDQLGASNLLGQSFRQLGYEVACESTFDCVFRGQLSSGSDILVTELKLANRSVLELLGEIRRLAPFARIAIVTNYPSVATAIRAVRLGADAYLPKPVTAALVLKALAAEGAEPSGDDAWPSLDRTIWEYLNQTVVFAGSLSEAARRLGVHRRSLRRMLSKYPPPR